jgi:hypothetical protein
LCGAVQFTFDEPPVAARACWCRDCQYLSAGNASVNAIFRTATFRCTGETRDYASKADSGVTMHRAFCPACGTPLFSRSENRPDLMVVRAGALDERELARPTGVIWTASAPGWGVVPPGLPTCPGQPGPDFGRAPCVPVALRS